MQRKEPEWWAEVRRLRATGMSHRKLAKAFNRAHSSIEYALDPDKYRRTPNGQRKGYYRRKRGDEPEWWAEARKLHAPPFSLSKSAIARVLHRERTAVIYALADPMWREMRKAKGAARYHKRLQERARKREYWRQRHMKTEPRLASI